MKMFMKFKKNQLLAIVLFIFFQFRSVRSFAFSTEELVMNSSIKTLIENHFTSIGGQNLQELRAQFAKVKIQDISGVPIGSCGRRLGMLNIPKTHSIFVPSAYLISILPKEILDTWLLHEGLEAVEIFDENYAFSVGVSWLAHRSKEDQAWFLSTDMMNQAIDAKQKVADCTTQFTDLLASGGSTGTGGGGDPLAIQLKMEIMDLIFKDFKILKSEAERLSLIHIFTRLLKLPLEAASFQPNSDIETLTRTAREIWKTG